MSNRDNLTVCGAGVLGGQIAWHSAHAGKNVVYDISDEALDACRGTHGNYAQNYQADVGATKESVEAAQVRLSYSTDPVNTFELTLCRVLGVSAVCSGRAAE